MNVSRIITGIPSLSARPVRAQKPVARLLGKLPKVAAVDMPTSDPNAPFDNTTPLPFTLKDVRDSIPDSCFQRDSWRSVDHLIKDVAVIAAIAYFAFTIDSWIVWPLYWLAQGTMFWALFVVGHDAGHGSFSADKKLNDFIGRITHTAIFVPFHAWRISHRTHHANHGHIENDESWVPMAKEVYDDTGILTRVGRFSIISLLAYPVYLFKGSPGKEGSHFDPNNRRLFTEEEGKLISFDNKLLLGHLAIQAALAVTLGVGAAIKLYWAPWLVYICWLDFVTFMHHHGQADENDIIPWYRGEEWSYLRGGISTRDHDYGMFNSIHHDIGTHVVHHLFPSIPHYNLNEATKAIKPVLGDFYKEPEASPGAFPTHLIKPWLQSLKRDHYVHDTDEILLQQTDPKVYQPVKGGL